MAPFAFTFWYRYFSPVPRDFGDSVER